jgi:hypothetical protein
MLRMYVCMHSRFVDNHPIWILEDGPLISEGDSVTTLCSENSPIAFNIKLIVWARHACHTIGNYD